jgi:hypothetical protein
MPGLLSNYKKYILYLIIGIIATYGIIWITTRKPQIPAEYRIAIDTLNKSNARLQAKQKQLDSTIQVYNAKIDELDIKIGNIKHKTTIIREYYNELSQTVNTYTPTQVDSFFKSRYSY